VAAGGACGFASFSTVQQPFQTLQVIITKTPTSGSLGFAFNLKLYVASVSKEKLMFESSQLTRTPTVFLSQPSLLGITSRDYAHTLSSLHHKLTTLPSTSIETEALDIVIFPCFFLLHFIPSNRSPRRRESSVLKTCFAQEFPSIDRVPSSPTRFEKVYENGQEFFLKSTSSGIL
jgi:hypothetical protein